jgi:adenylyltransferase/sulfurtransferase
MPALWRVSPLLTRNRAAPCRCRLSIDGGPGHVLIDVRPPEQFDICHIPGAVSAPYKNFGAHLDAIEQRVAAVARAAGATQPAAPPALYVVCRRGNDSQRAVAALREAGLAHAVDVVGGVEAWAREVDPGFPLY